MTDQPPKIDAMKMTNAEYEKHLAEWIRPSSQAHSRPTEAPATAPLQNQAKGVETEEPKLKNCLDMSPAEFTKHCKDTGFYSTY